MKQVRSLGSAAWLASAVGLLAPTACSGDVSGSGAPPEASTPDFAPTAGVGTFPAGPDGTVPPGTIGTPTGIPSTTPTAAVPSTALPGPEPAASVPAGTPGTSVPYTVPEAVSPALEARAWKLTHDQYRASIEALLDVEVPLEDENGPRLAVESSNGVFLNLSDSGFVSIANGLAEGYMEIAGEVSDDVAPERLAALGGCTALGPSCARDTFLGAALGKVFRRPATPEDVALFAELFDAAQAEAAAVADDTFAYRSSLKAMLTSPYFLYRTEIGVDPAAQEFQLSAYEVASFLAYSVLGQPPSEQLLAAAAAGTLGDPVALRAEVEAMLAEPEAEAQFHRFMTEWLEVEAFLDPDFGLGRDDVKVAQGFDAVKHAMQEETESFLATNGTLDGTLAALLTAPVETEDPALAEFYRSEPTGAGAPPDRVGIFALGAGLSVRAKDASTSPTLRGLFVRERLMCQHFQIPPGVNPDLSDLQAEATPETTRELYELHALDPTCSGCHALFDPLGFTLETFDEVGRFRSTQSGVAIDTTAKLIASDVDQDLTNHVDLAHALAESTWVRECLARQAFRYYFGTTTSLILDSTGTRREEDRGLPPIQAGRAALTSGGDLRTMVAAVLTSESTLARTRREPEQL